MERKWHRLEEDEARAGTKRALNAYVVLLSQVTSFNYLGRVIVAEEKDWPEVARNLRRTRYK